MESKKAYKEALEQGIKIVARENTPRGQFPIEHGTVTFEGPHFPAAHRFYGKAVVENGHVTEIK